MSRKIGSGHFDEIAHYRVSDVPPPCPCGTAAPGCVPRVLAKYKWLSTKYCFFPALTSVLHVLLALKNQMRPGLNEQRKPWSRFCVLVCASSYRNTLLPHASAQRSEAP